MRSCPSSACARPGARSSGWSATPRSCTTSGADGWVVQHIQAPEQSERLIARCREIFDSEPLFTSEVGPVIGTYTGPGLIGVGALPRSLLG